MKFLKNFAKLKMIAFFGDFSFDLNLGLQLG